MAPTLLILVAMFGLFPVQITGCGPSLNNDTALYLPMGWELQSAPVSAFFPTYLDFQGLRMQFGDSGQIQIVELANNNVVWGFGGNSKGCNSTSSCSFRMQGDGNLVLYYSDGTAAGTGTDVTSPSGGYVLLQTSPPYLSVTGFSCVVVWPNGSGKASLGPLPRTTPVLGGTTDLNITATALPATTWRSRFGVNTHMSQGWSAAMVYNLTTYLGVSIIRDGLPSGGQLPDFLRMTAEGIKLNFVMGGVANKAALQTRVQTLSSFQQNYTGSILQIEGFNEINNFGFIYNGINNSVSYAGMFQAMKDLYSLVKGTPNLANVPVIDMTGSCFSDGGTLGCQNYTGRADFGNIHMYQSNGETSVSIQGNDNNFLYGLAGSYISFAAASNFAVTETGYHTDNFTDGITELAQGKLIVNTLLNAIATGLRQTFIYELIDEVWAGYSGPQSHYGLFHNNLTTKPAARALRFLSGLLNDTNGGSDTLSFSLNGFPVGGQYLLFQKSDGTFVLVVWNNSPVYNPLTRSDITTAAVQVTLQLPASTTVQVYDIYSTTADDSLPLAPSSTLNGASVAFSMSDKAVVLQFTAPASSSSSASSCWQGYLLRTLF